MGITLTLEQGNIAHYKLTDPLTWPEIYAVDVKARQIYDSASGPVHVLVEAQDVKHIPDGLLKVRANAELTHKNVGTIVVVGAPIFLQYLIEVALRLTRKKAQFCKSPEEAWDYLKRAIVQVV